MREFYYYFGLIGVQINFLYIYSYGYKWCEPNVDACSIDFIPLPNSTFSKNESSLTPCTEYVANIVAYTEAGPGLFRNRSAYSSVQGLPKYGSTSSIL